MADNTGLDQENQELTESIHVAYESIEAAVAMTDFQEYIAGGSPVDAILKQSGERLRKLLPLDAEAFFLANEESGALELAYCRPGAAEEQINALIEEEIESGNVHRALRDQRPILLVPKKTGEGRLLLHALCTSRRCRGLFAGLYRSGRRRSDRLALLLMSLVLSHSASALESAALYQLFLACREKERDRLAVDDERGGLIQELSRVLPADATAPATELLRTFKAHCKNGSIRRIDLPKELETAPPLPLRRAVPVLTRLYDLLSEFDDAANGEIDVALDLPPGPEGAVALEVRIRGKSSRLEEIKTRAERTVSGGTSGSGIIESGSGESHLLRLRFPVQ